MLTNVARGRPVTTTLANTFNGDVQVITDGSPSMADEKAGESHFVSISMRMPLYTTLYPRSHVQPFMSVPAFDGAMPI